MSTHRHPGTSVSYHATTRVSLNPYSVRFAVAHLRVRATASPCPNCPLEYPAIRPPRRWALASASSGTNPPQSIFPSLAESRVIRPKPTPAKLPAFPQITPHSPCPPRHSSEIMDRINTRPRTKIQSRGYRDHSQQSCPWRTSSFGAMRQLQSGIEAASDQPPCPHPFPESLAPPDRFTLVRRRHAKRVYQKTATGRSRDANHKLHHARRTAAPQRGAPVPAHQGTPGHDEGGGVGCQQRRSQ